MGTNSGETLGLSNWVFASLIIGIMTKLKLAFLFLPANFNLTISGALAVAVIILLRIWYQRRAQRRMQEEVRNIFFEYLPVDGDAGFEMDQIQDKQNSLRQALV